MILSAAFAITIPLLFLFAVWTLEIYNISRKRLLAVSFAWGMASFGFAYLAQEGILASGLLRYEQVTAFSAPLVEELLKSAFLIVIMRQMMLAYAPEGTAYGFAVGTGFAIVENLFYLSAQPNAAFIDTITRILSANLMHAFTSGLVGTVVGVHFYHSRRRRVFHSTVIIVIVIGVHMLFNLVASHTDGIALTLLSIAIGFSGAIAMVIMLSHAMRDETRAISHELTELTHAGEAIAAANPQQIIDVIHKHASNLGYERAERLQKYVKLQAKRALLVKTLALNERPLYDTTLRHRLEHIELQLEALRGQMGIYHWVWLRRALPSNESPLWEQFDHEIQRDDATLASIITVNQRKAELPVPEIQHRKYLLRHNHLFDALTDEALEDIAVMMHEMNFTHGQRIITQGEHNHHLYLVSSGLLTVSACDSQGIETVIDTYRRGDFFGEISLIDEQPAPISIVGVGEGVLHCLSREDLFVLLYTQPQIALAIMRKMTFELREQIAFVTYAREALNQPQC